MGRVWQGPGLSWARCTDVHAGLSAVTRNRATPLLLQGRSRQARLFVRALLPFIDKRRILPEVFLRLSLGLGGEEALHQPDLLGNGGDAVAVGIIGPEHDAVFAERAVQID